MCLSFVFFKPNISILLRSTRVLGATAAGCAMAFYFCLGAGKRSLRNCTTHSAAVGLHHDQCSPHLNYINVLRI